VSSGTAEEFYSRCLANAQILEAAALQRAESGDGVGALADAWGADVSTLQAVMWERVLVAARTPQRQFFQVAGALVAGLRAPASAADTPTLGRMIARARERMATAFDDSLMAEMAGRWPVIDYLDDVPAVSADDVAAAVVARLQGMSPQSFADMRRAEARTTMLEAQTCRVRGETSAAIQLAYEADFKALEAYLVDSAVAVGDDQLFTVTMRWDLAVQAVTGLPGLPDDFSAAVTAIRSVLAEGLGEADGGRLLETLAPV
jgi:hypothetical protein